MTVTIDQAMRGAMRYADNAVIPPLPAGTGIGAGTMLALIIERSQIDDLFTLLQDVLQAQD